MRALLLHHEEQLRAGRPHHPWPTQGWALPCALLTLEELLLGTSGRQLPNDHRRRPHHSSPWWGRGLGQE
jgi:hypothetical protein